MRPHRLPERLDSFLHLHWRTLLALFVLIFLPLFGFAQIAEDVYHKEPFGFEIPLMRLIHRHPTPLENHVAATFSLFGSARGMVPLSLLLVAALYRLRKRLVWFALSALVGVALMNFLMKQFFNRPRPTLWTPFLPEPDSSFPSGHAMFATALVGTLLAIFWSTRWRWPILTLGALYVLGMMWSRVYIGVHYPTDVTGGALVSTAWVGALSRFTHAHRVLARRGDEVKRESDIVHGARNEGK